VRLNGRGVQGADGTKVYSGMLAAPWTYPFGTKIFIPGFGLGTVHDRGGAIVSAGNRNQTYDRIDIWMGTGEEGLLRALSWGIRTVEGILYPVETDVQGAFSFKSIPISFSKSPSYFSSSLQKGNTGDQVYLLQKKLETLDYYSGIIHGKYDDKTREAVLQFQLEHNVIPQEDSLGAGIFGPKTQKTFSRVFSEVQNKYFRSIVHTSQFLPSGMALGSQGKNISYLHQVLKTFGYYSGSLTEEFSEHTELAVKNFQKEYGIIASKDDYGAGVFGPKTQKKVLEIFSEQERILGKGVLKQRAFASSFPGKKRETLKNEDNVVRKKQIVLIPSPSMRSKSFHVAQNETEGNNIASSSPEENILVQEFSVLPSSDL
jgi:peptidoglycan hydrolase-like protein with peptidoglycan-binding domain/3D (Asp-Asp-Asp) domain-containing protein